MKLLVRDGLPDQVKSLLQDNGYTIVEVMVAHEQLGSYISKHDIDMLMIRQSNRLNRHLVDQLIGLKYLVLSGTECNLDSVEYAMQKGIQVLWAEDAVSNARAELILGHLLSGCRLLHESNRNMPLEGDINFRALHNSYSNGVELYGKCLGLIGMDKAALKLAQKALGLGMQVIYCDKLLLQVEEEIHLPNGIEVKFKLESKTMNEVVEKAHFLSLHSPVFEKHLIDKEMFDNAKNLIGMINCSYAEGVDEVALIDAINEEKILFAGLDRFEEEPTPAIQVLMQPAISLSPNIGGATGEATERVWKELLAKLIEIME